MKLRALARGAKSRAEDRRLPSPFAAAAKGLGSSAGFWYRDKRVIIASMKIRGFRRLSSTLLVATGVVLIWRGMWVLVDLIDNGLFGRETYFLAFSSIAIGILILYFHHHRESGEEHF